MDFITRLRYFMDSAGITISQFADTCGIPRPTMSQLMNGRNKRISDEVINKIHTGYPELSILWLMFGEGEMGSTSNIETSEAQNGSNFERVATNSSDLQDVESSFQGELPLDQEVPDNSEFAESMFSSSVYPGSAPFSASSSTGAASSNRMGSTAAPNSVVAAGAAAGSSPIASGASAAAGSTMAPGSYAATGAPVAAGSPVASANSGSSVYGNQTSIPYTQAKPRPYVIDDENFSNGSYNANGASQTPRNQSQQRKYAGDVTRSLGDIPREEPASANASGVFISDASSDEPRVSISPDAHKKITNIVVFYSDNSFQSFLPDL